MNEKLEVVKYSRKLITDRLTEGTGGNISMYNREKNLMYITPSGIDYMEMREEDIVVMTLDGKIIEGTLAPSSEYDLHRIFYKNTDNINAVVHTHSPYATTIACLNKEIPPVHYLVGFGGKKIPCSPYYTYGTPELAESVFKTMGTEYSVSLMANHGLIAVGNNLMKTFEKASMIEFVAGIYYRTLCCKNPVLLSEKEMEKIVVKFQNYGQKK